MIAGNSVVEWFTRYCGKRTALLLWALAIQVIATIGVGLVDSFWLAVPLYLISMAALGVWSPVRHAYIHQIIPSEQRATVISFDSLVTSTGSAVSQFSLGRLAQTRSIAVGYVIGGITMAIALPFVYRLRKRGDEADIIVGTAGKQGACPVQGIPQVSAVDSNAGLADT
jgi:MFS family permease